MARTYTDTVQWRSRANSTQDWTGWYTETTNGISPFTFASPLATNKEYEVQIVRQRAGSVTKTSNGADETQSSYYLVVGTVSLVSGAAMSFPGTYSVPSLGSSVTVTRTKGGSPSLSIDLGGANWYYVAVKYNDGSERYKAVLNTGRGSSVDIGGNTYTADTSVLAESGKNTNIINVKLPSSQAFTLYVDYNGNSSGSIQVKAV